jgi:hypothetical protein
MGLVLLSVELLFLLFEKLGFRKGLLLVYVDVASGHLAPLGEETPVQRLVVRLLYVHLALVILDSCNQVTRAFVLCAHLLKLVSCFV